MKLRSGASRLPGAACVLGAACILVAGCGPAASTEAVREPVPRGGREVQEAPRVSWPELDLEPRGPVRVHGLEDAELERMGESLSLHVDVPGRVPAMTGELSVGAGELAFRPRYPWRAGETYRLELVLASGEPRVVRHAFPAPVLVPETRVTAVYPSSATLPENVLRFYVHFSAPMSRLPALDHVRLLDEHGEALEDVFLELGQELWDPERRRLTLLLDPGRIKRGLRPNEDLGNPLEAGKGYALVVDAAWKDARGAPLVEGHRHAFRAGPPDRTQPSFDSWTAEPPAAGTREPWRLSFPEPLDQALLERMLRVLDPAGRPVPGRVEVAPGERAWSFVPDAPWRSGVHELEVDTALEDVAGNSLARPFEVAFDTAGEVVETGPPVRASYDLRPDVP